MSTTMTLQEKASEAAGWFETATRDSGETFIRTKDGAPEWVGELVYAAHGSAFLPDDWRYKTTRRALEWIADDGDPDDSGEFADDCVDVYTGARIEWLASNLNRAGYVDEAVEELGGHASGIIEMIGIGQYAEASEVYGLVVDALRNLADVDEEA